MQTDISRSYLAFVHGDRDLCMKLYRNLNLFIVLCMARKQIEEKKKVKKYKQKKKDTD